MNVCSIYTSLWAWVQVITQWAYSQYCTGWHIRLFTRLSWHQSKSWVSVYASFAKTQLLLWCQLNLEISLVNLYKYVMFVPFSPFSKNTEVQNKVDKGCVCVAHTIPTFLFSLDQNASGTTIATATEWYPRTCTDTMDTTTTTITIITTTVPSTGTAPSCARSYSGQSAARTVGLRGEIFQMVNRVTK